MSTEQTINHLLIDKRGVLWYGSLSGLAAYDGVNHFHFSKTELGVQSNAISCIRESPDGTIWIGTESDLVYFDYTTAKFTRVNAVAPNGLSICSKVNDINSDSEGRIWVSVKGQGLYCYDRGADALSSFLYNPEDNLIPPKIQNIEFDRNEDIFCAIYFDGLMRISSDKSKLERLEFAGIDFKDKNITDILATSNAFYVACPEFGLCELSFTSKRAKILIPNTSKFSYAKLSCSDDVNIVMATDAGAILYDRKNGLVSSISLQNTEGLEYDSFFSVATDGRGDIVLGGEFGDIYYVSSEAPAVKRYSSLSDGDPLANSAPRSFTSDENGNMWIGTRNKGILYLDSKTGNLSRYHVPVSIESVNSICYSDGFLWIAVPSFLYRYDTETGRMESYDASIIGASSISDRPIYPIHKLPSGDVMFCHALGIAMFDKQSMTFFNLPGLEEYNVNSVAEDGEDGTIWLSTYAHGLKKYDIRSHSEVPFACDTHEWIMSNKRLNSVYVDSCNRTWVASNDDGFAVITPDDEIILYSMSTNTSLPSDRICSFQEDRDGNVWVSTENGLVRFGPNLEESVNYGAANGFLSNKFIKRSSFQGTDGSLYFGSRDGFVSFQGADIPKSSAGPSGLYISGFTVESHPEVSLSLVLPHLNNGTPLILKPGQNTFSVRFSRPGLPTSAGGYVSCKLDGIDYGWHRTNINNTETWRSVRYGRHTLHARSISDSGAVEYELPPLDIRIRRPAMRSTIAILLYSLILLTAIFNLIYRVFKRMNEKALENQKRILEQQIANTPERKLLRAAQLHLPVYTVIVPNISEKEAKFLNRIESVIEPNISNEQLSYSFIASELCIGRQTLNIKFKSITGVTINDYIRLARLCASVRILDNKDQRINEACFSCGFNTPSYYSKCFKDAFGMLPAEYRKSLNFPE